MKRFVYACSFFAMMCWNEHRVWHEGHGDKWWVSLFAAVFCGMNFVLSIEGLEKR